MDVTRRAAIAALTSGWISIARAQDSETVSKRRPAWEDAGEQPVIRVDVNLVNLFCTVRKHKGDLVTNLTQDDFRVFEDGQEQTVTAFSRETDLPVMLGMLVDISGSQRNLIGTERDAASAFFSNVMRKQDEAFLITFGHDTDLLQDYTSSVPKLQSALNNLQGDVARVAGTGQRPGGGGPGGGGGANGGPWGGLGGGGRHGGYGGGGNRRPQQHGNGKGTLMFDAIYLASHDELAAKQGRKAMILITDGEDRGSYYGRAQAIEQSQRADSIIYSIYYVDHNAYRGLGGGHDEGNGLSDLEGLSRETGGRVFKVSKDLPLSKVFNDIQQQMRSQYSLAYKSSQPASPGQFRRVEIRTRSSDFEVQARNGYYAK
jgi:VWFA-related protein